MFLLFFLQHSFSIFINIFSRRSGLRAACDVHSTTQRDASAPRIYVYIFVQRKDGFIDGYDACSVQWRDVYIVNFNRNKTL